MSNELVPINEQVRTISTNFFDLYDQHREFNRRLLESIQSGDKSIAANGLRLTGKLLRGWTELEERTKHAKALDLRVFQIAWNTVGHDGAYDYFKECNFHDPDFKKEDFNYSFEQAVKILVQKTNFHITGSWSMDDSTIRNYCRVARIWLTGETEVNPPDEITLIDPKTGNFEIDEYGEPAVVTWDPFRVLFSKLQIACPCVEEETMNEIHWGLLANPRSSYSDIRHYFILELQPWDFEPIPGRSTDRRFISINGGIMFVCRRGGLGGVEFGTLEVDNEDPDVAWAVSRTLKFLNASVNG